MNVRDMKEEKNALCVYVKIDIICLIFCWFDSNDVNYLDALFVNKYFYVQIVLQNITRKYFGAVNEILYRM